MKEKVARADKESQIRRIIKAVELLQIKASNGEMMSVRDYPLTKIFEESGIIPWYTRQAFTEVLKVENLLITEGKGVGLLYRWQGEIQDNDMHRLAERIRDNGVKISQTSITKKRLQNNTPFAQKSVSTANEKLHSGKPEKIRTLKKWERFGMYDKCYIMHNNRIREGMILGILADSHIADDAKITYTVRINNNGAEPVTEPFDLVFSTPDALVEYLKKTINKP